MRQKSYPNIFRYNRCFLLEPYRSNIDCVLLKNMTVLNILFAPISKENRNTAKEKGLVIFYYFFSLWNRSKSWYYKVVTNTFRQRRERTWSLAFTFVRRISCGRVSNRKQFIHGRIRIKTQQNVVCSENPKLIFPLFSL